MPEFSIVVTTYNQKLADICLTLCSALLQKDVTTEIIIADDFSTEDQTADLELFFESFGYKDYTIKRPDHNRGTVRNYLEAANLAVGKYLKMIGPGDLFFDDTTLADMRDFCDANEVKLAFGRIISFTKGSEDGKTQRYRAPGNSSAYAPEAGAEARKLLRHQLFHSDWIPGIAQFGSTEYTRGMLSRLAEEYQVKLCEDFITTLSLAQDVKPLFYDADICWYEFGNGVSTSVNMDTVKRLYQDHANMYRRISNDNAFNERFIGSKLFFKLRRAAVSNERIYTFLHKRRSNNYMSERLTANSADRSAPVNSFYKLCHEKTAEYLGRDRHRTLHQAG